MPGGFTKYNAYQKALSSYLKDSGISLKDSGKKFHEVASTIYRQTKTAPLKHTLNNIDRLVDNIVTPPTTVPELTSTQLEGFPYFNFVDEVSGFMMPDNLLINSFTIKEQEILAPAFTYETCIKKFSDFCNNSKTAWNSPQDYPELRFSIPTPHPTLPGMYVTELTSDDEDNYGFIPDEEDLEFIAPQPIEEEIPEEEVPEEITTKEDKIAKAKVKAEKRAIAIKKLDIQSKKLDVKMQKQNIQLFDRYEKLYDKGILTKAEFKQKVMELKL